MKALVQEVEANLGAIDLLVNNAGTGGPLARFWETDPEAWWRCQEVNLRGPMLCCRAVLPGMIRRRAGRIVNVASGAGCQALRSQQDSVDSLQRATLSGTRRARQEARHLLPFIQKMRDDGADVSPDKVANLVQALASGRADMLSGRLFSVHECGSPSVP